MSEWLLCERGIGLRKINCPIGEPVEMEIIMGKKCKNPETIGLWSDQYAGWIVGFVVLNILSLAVLIYAFKIPSSILIIVILFVENLVQFAIMALVNRCPECRLPLQRKLYRRKSAGSRNEQRRVTTSSGGSMSVTQNIPIFKYLYRCRSCDHRWSIRK